MKHFIWALIVLSFGAALIWVLREYLTDQNVIEAEKAKVDCLIKSATIDETKFDKGFCYHIIQYKTPKI